MINVSVKEKLENKIVIYSQCGFCLTVMHAGLNYLQITNPMQTSNCPVCGNKLLVIQNVNNYIALLKYKIKVRETQWQKLN